MPSLSSAGSLRKGVKANLALLGSEMDSDLSRGVTSGGRWSLSRVSTLFRRLNRPNPESFLEQLLGRNSPVVNEMTSGGRS
jgi:hypothetical protein